MFKSALRKGILLGMTILAAIYVAPFIWLLLTSKIPVWAVLLIVWAIMKLAASVLYDVTKDTLIMTKDLRAETMLLKHTLNTIFSNYRLEEREQS